MSLTTDLKSEIARTSVSGQLQDPAYIASLIRFAGGLHLVAGRIVIEAELDCQVGAENLRQALKERYKVDSDMVVVSSSGIRRGERYVVRVVHGADRLARLTGLIDSRGRPIRGLPPRLVSGNSEVAVSCWRGAFMARGSLMEPGRSAAMEITCPGPETALALVGIARRMDAVAKSREVRGVDRVMVRDGEQISHILALMNCSQTQSVWEERRKARELRGSVNRLANFDDANLRRSVRAAVTAGARLERAFEILGEEVPAHLVEAGRLRIQFKEASLEELGQKSVPPLTKDAVAGRIRRLLAMADNRAHDLQIPDTSSAITPEMLDD